MMQVPARLGSGTSQAQGTGTRKCRTRHRTERERERESERGAVRWEGWRLFPAEDFLNATLLTTAVCGAGDGPEAWFDDANKADKQGYVISEYCVQTDHLPFQGCTVACASPICQTHYGYEYRAGYPGSYAGK